MELRVPVFDHFIGLNLYPVNLYSKLTGKIGPDTVGLYMIASPIDSSSIKKTDCVREDRSFFKDYGMYSFAGKSVYSSREIGKYTINIFICKLCVGVV